MLLHDNSTSYFMNQPSDTSEIHGHGVWLNHEHQGLDPVGRVDPWVDLGARAYDVQHGIGSMPWSFSERKE